MKRTSAALVIASAASIAGTRPRVSIIPRAIPIVSAICLLLCQKIKNWLNCHSLLPSARHACALLLCTSVLTLVCLHVSSHPSMMPQIVRSVIVVWSGIASLAALPTVVNTHFPGGAPAASGAAGAAPGGPGGARGGAGPGPGARRGRAGAAAARQGAGRQPPGA